MAAARVCWQVLIQTNTRSAPTPPLIAANLRRRAIRRVTTAIESGRARWDAHDCSSAATAVDRSAPGCEIGCAAANGFPLLIVIEKAPPRFPCSSTLPSTSVSGRASPASRLFRQQAGRTADLVRALRSELLRRDQEDGVGGGVVSRSPQRNFVSCLVESLDQADSVQVLRG